MMAKTLYLTLSTRSKIFAGQRCSFVLNANKPTSGNYWIRAEPSVGDSTSFDGGLNSAILRYEGADDVDPNTASSVSNPMKETNLIPRSNPGAPGIAQRGAADVNINLQIQFNRN